MSRNALLIVDDEKLVLDSLKAELRDAFADRFSIEVSQSAEDALELYREMRSEDRRIPVVIADYIMPGMRGDDLLRTIHEIDPATRKIMLTGQADAGAVGNAVNYARLYRYIPKPWDPTDLVLTINEAIRSFEQDLLVERQNRELREMNVILERKVDERTHELQEANNAKDKFFSIIAHDLRNPLTALMGSTDLLLHYFGEFDEEQLKKIFREINQSTKSLHLLLENLLIWARSQRGLIECNRENLDLSYIVGQTVALLEKTAGEKKIRLETYVSKETWVKADMNMIMTVVRNLASNALKFTPPDGRVTISTRFEGDTAVVSVEDTGMGIEPKNLSKLFRIDQNFTTRGTANEKGSGLGLILCQEFVNRHGGRIWVESEPGKGSRFSFTIPPQR